MITTPIFRIGDYLYRKISVIIPTYNAEKYLQQAINSIVNQSFGFENIELLLIDDNSKDKTPEILKSLSNKYSNVKIIFLEGNSGSAAKGRNVGIKNATTDYVMFLDQDDKYDERMCEIMYNTIENNDVDIVMCCHKSFLQNKFYEIDNTGLDLTFIKEDPKENELIFNDIFMWDKIFRRDFLLENNIECPEEHLSEDMVFCINAYLNTGEIIYLSKYEGYLYNIRDSEDDSSTSNSITKESYLKLLNGYYGTVNLFKDANREDLIPLLMKTHYVTLISSFIRLNKNVTKESKILLLKELHDFQEYSKINYYLNETWTNFFIRNIKRKNFNRIIFISNIINRFYKSHKLRKMYRKFYNKSTY